MGYACPVCSDPQADGGHLANHLAFTAMLGDDAHDAWLDEHAPGWGEMGEAELADVVVGDVEATEFPQVFEDTAGGMAEEGDPPAERSGALFDGQPHGGGDGHSVEDAPETGSGVAGGPDNAEPLDEEAAAILEAAREMTRQMLGDTPTDRSGTGGPSSTDAESAADEPPAAADQTDPDESVEAADGQAGADNNE
jgi:hypothetical protein